MNRRLLRAIALALALCLALSAAALAEPVQVYPRTLRLSPKKLALSVTKGVAGSARLTAVTEPALGTLSEKLTWTSDNPAVATVTDQGVVTAADGGSTYVRASIQGAGKVLSVACKVSVKVVRAKSIKLNQTEQVTLSHTSSKNHTYQMTALVLPSTTSFPQVTWTSSDESVATVKNGLVTAVNAGSCTVTATADKGRVSASCPVFVRDASGVKTVTFSAGGDIVLGGDKNKRTDQRFARFYTTYGPEYVLKNLKQVFARDDVTILNLEGPLKGGQIHRSGREYNFYGKPEYAGILTAGSVEVANLANNHIDDYGTKGATESILLKAGILLSDYSFKPSRNMMLVDGVRVGFIGFLTPYYTAALKRRIKTAKSKCDILIVSLHFGAVPERTNAVAASQRISARNAVDAGADIVLGHHTHVTSGIETYKGRYIYYGLGAVESSGSEFKYNNFITQQEIKVDLSTGAVECQVPTLYPISTSSAPLSEDNNCQPALLSPSDPRYDEVFQTIDTYSKRGQLVPAPYNKGTP